MCHPSALVPTGVDRPTGVTDAPVVTAPSTNPPPIGVHQFLIDAELEAKNN